MKLLIILFLTNIKTPTAKINPESSSIPAITIPTNPDNRVIKINDAILKFIARTAESTNANM